MKNNLLNVPLYIWFSFLFFSLLFIFVPQIDIYVSNLFFSNNTFPLKGSLFESFFYKSVPIIVTIAAISSILIFFYNILNKKNIFGINKRVILYIVLVLSIAPGLIVNSLFKEHWGRARPNQTIIFGADKEFTPPFILSQENGNSFSCGHGAAAFSMVGLALLIKRRKKLWLGLAFGYGILVSIARIIAGGHFLSDTVTSFFIVYISTLMLYGWLIKDRN